MKRLVLLVLCVCFTAQSFTVAPSAQAQAVKPLLVDRFDCNTTINALGQSRGPAYNPPDSLTEEYPKRSGAGCMAQLKFSVQAWAAYWEKLGVPLCKHSLVEFQIKAVKNKILAAKIEIKRGDQTSILYIRNIGTSWVRHRLPFKNFISTPWNAPQVNFSDCAPVEELVFTFELAQSGPTGTVQLDNIYFK